MVACWIDLLDKLKVYSSSTWQHGVAYIAEFINRIPADHWGLLNQGRLEQKYATPKEFSSTLLNMNSSKSKLKHEYPSIDDLHAVMTYKNAIIPEVVVNLVVLEWHLVKTPVRRSQPQLESRVVLRRFPYARRFNPDQPTLILWCYAENTEGYCELIGIQQLESKHITFKFESTGITAKLVTMLEDWSKIIYKVRTDADLPPSYDELTDMIKPLTGAIMARLKNNEESYKKHVMHTQIVEYGRVIGLYAYKIFWPCRPSTANPFEKTVSLADFRRKSPIQTTRATNLLLCELLVGNRQLTTADFTAVWTALSPTQETLSGIIVRPVYKLYAENLSVLASHGFYISVEFENSNAEKTLINNMEKVSLSGGLNVAQINDATVKYRRVPKLQLSPAEEKERRSAIEEVFIDESYELMKMAIPAADYERIKAKQNLDAITEKLKQRVVVMDANQVLTDDVVLGYERASIRTVSAPHYDSAGRVVVLKSSADRLFSRLEYEMRELPFFHRPPVVVDPYKFVSTDSVLYL
jgi:hypothetical protein